MLHMNLRANLVDDESSTSAIPNTRDRLYRKKSDTQDPSFVFSAEEMSLLEAVLGQANVPKNIMVKFILSY